MREAKTIAGISFSKTIPYFGKLKKCDEYVGKIVSKYLDKILENFNEIIGKITIRNFEDILHEMFKHIQ